VGGKTLRASPFSWGGKWAIWSQDLSDQEKEAAVGRQGKSNNDREVKSGIQERKEEKKFSQLATRQGDQKSDLARHEGREKGRECTCDSAEGQGQKNKTATHVHCQRNS